MDSSAAIILVKTLAENLNAKKQLFSFIDLHSHLSKTGSFVFGNFSKKSMDKNIEIQTWPHIMEMICKEFDLNSSGFQKIKKILKIVPVS